MAPRDPFENSAYCKQYYRDNADAIRAKKRPQARAYKQRVLLQRAIETARIELQPFFPESAIPTQPRSER